MLRGRGDAYAGRHVVRVHHADPIGQHEVVDLTPRPPVLLDHLLDDPGLIRWLVEERAPYWPVQRYVANTAEYATLSGAQEPAQMVVAPVFRGNWALAGTPVVERPDHASTSGALADLLDHPRLVEAARTVFGAGIVRPDTIYVNLTWQLPFAQGAGHTDIPAFVGFDRTEHPVTFLTIMGLSGLFDAERVKVATGVAWFYEGADGGFEYWPSGPDAPSAVHEGDIHNTAIVADNDFMWHRVRPTGRVDDGMLTLHLDSELVRLGGDRWAIRGDGTDPARELAQLPFDRVRVSLSWKALVYDDADDERRHREQRGALDLATVVGRFVEDLRRRGLDVDVPSDPERDPAFIRVLQDTYVRYPVVAV